MASLPPTAQPADEHTSPDQLGYVVRRGFDPGGIKFEPDEVVLVRTGRWHYAPFFNVKNRLIKNGSLEKLPDGTPVWRCACGGFATFWSTPELATRHSCYGEQTKDDPALAQTPSAPNVQAAAADPSLSERDAEIVRLWNEGRTAPQIAGTLGTVTAKRIENLIGTLRKKLGPAVVPYRSDTYRSTQPKTG